MKKKIIHEYMRSIFKCNFKYVFAPMCVRLLSFPLLILDQSQLTYLVLHAESYVHMFVLEQKQL